MATNFKPSRKSPSRTVKRYVNKRSVTPRPVSLVGGGQGGLLSPSGNAGSAWG